MCDSADQTIKRYLVRSPPVVSARVFSKIITKTHTASSDGTTFSFRQTLRRKQNRTSLAVCEFCQTSVGMLSFFPVALFGFMCLTASSNSVLVRSCSVIVSAALFNCFLLYTAHIRRSCCSTRLSTEDCNGFCFDHPGLIDCYCFFLCSVWSKLRHDWLSMYDLEKKSDLHERFSLFVRQRHVTLKNP